MFALDSCTPAHKSGLNQLIGFSSVTRTNQSHSIAGLFFTPRSAEASLAESEASRAKSERAKTLLKARLTAATRRNKNAGADTACRLGDGFTRDRTTTKTCTKSGGDEGACRDEERRGGGADGGRRVSEAETELNIVKTSLSASVAHVSWSCRCRAHACFRALCKYAQAFFVEVVAWSVLYWLLVAEGKVFFQSSECLRSHGQSGATIGLPCLFEACVG